MTLELRGKLFLGSIAIALGVVVPVAVLLGARLDGATDGEVGLAGLLLVAVGLAVVVALGIAALWWRVLSRSLVLERSVSQLGRELEASVRELGSEHDRLETVLEGMTDAVVAIDEESRITLANSAARILLNEGKNPTGLCLPYLPGLADLATLCVSGREGPTEEELVLPAGQRILARATPLRSSRGVVIVINDVTEIRRLEEIRKDFIANASHELRTPISVIRAHAETLLAGALDEPEHARRFAEGLHRNAERLSQIVTDLLDLSRLEEGRVDLAVEPVSLGAAVGRAATALERAASTKRIEVLDEAPNELTCMADAQALDHVLFNLLDNAVKYTPAGGRIVLDADGEGDRVQIRISDSGPGIEPQHHARIFERFYRVDPGRSREMGGTGLGLSIVKHLVEAMDGRVGVEPGDRGGSVFWVSLPAR